MFQIYFTLFRYGSDSKPTAVENRSQVSLFNPMKFFDGGRNVQAFFPRQTWDPTFDVLLLGAAPLSQTAERHPAKVCSADGKKTTGFPLTSGGLISSR